MNFALSHFLTESRCPPRIKSEDMLFRKMLWFAAARGRYKRKRRISRCHQALSDDLTHPRVPNSPRGKNSTTRMKMPPMNDIQFTVIDEI